MRLVDILTEALTPSQYRPLVRGWDKSKYAKLFNKQYRLYIPLDNTLDTNLTINPAIEQIIQSSGYQIDNYRDGIASQISNPDRKIKIGKLLKKPYLQQLFANDPVRAAAKRPQVVVISRHPYDIAGMSTDRGWTSCMNLKTGANKEYIPIDIKAGTIIAYLINETDTNINNPIARMLIKPFKNIINNSVALGIENKVYGTGSPAFINTVRKWVDSINDSHKLDGIYMLTPGLYQDGYDASQIFGDKISMPMWGQISTSPESFLIQHPDAPEDAKLAAVTNYGIAIQYIKNPSEKLQLAAVKSNAGAIRYIKNPSEKLQLLAVTKYGPTIRYIENPSEKVQLVAVTKNVEAIEYIKNPTEKVTIISIKNAPNTIRFIENPSEKLQLLAVKSNAGSIKYIKNPTEKVTIVAVRGNPYMIDYINNPSKELQLLATKLRNNQ